MPVVKKQKVKEKWLLDHEVVTYICMFCCGCPYNNNYIICLIHICSSSLSPFLQDTFYSFVLVNEERQGEADTHFIAFR